MVLFFIRAGSPSTLALYAAGSTGSKPDASLAGMGGYNEPECHHHCVLSSLARKAGRAGALPIAPHTALLYHGRRRCVCRESRLRTRKIVADHALGFNRMRQHPTGLCSPVLGCLRRCWGAYYTISGGSAPVVAADNGAEPSPFQRAKHNYGRT